MIRLAVIVSHPIQYYAPLYRRLAARGDVRLRVFFTWHSAGAPTLDRGFQRAFKWDVPLTEGYDWEYVPNASRDPGMHHFMGLRNPGLAARVLAWNPDAVHLTGYAWYSHLMALRTFSRRGLPVLFRGDSHLLDGAGSGMRWHAKKALLSRVFAWPAAFLCVGTANRAYYEAFGVEPERLHPCPHSIDVGHFANNGEEAEAHARAWRAELGICGDCTVLLFAGKFEAKKRPVELMQAVRAIARPDLVLVMVGDGELAGEVRRMADADPGRYRVVPFQNQSRMPVVYRLGDLFVLPSSFGETWGLGANESLACSRPVLLSTRVGCAADVVDESCGAIFAADDWDDFARVLERLLSDRVRLRAMRAASLVRARAFDVPVTEAATMDCLARTLAHPRRRAAP
jgi:glycosyltransferase involved in cell wall biosynthesis